MRIITHTEVPPGTPGQTNTTHFINSDLMIVVNTILGLLILFIATALVILLLWLTLECIRFCGLKCKRAMFGTPEERIERDRRITPTPDSVTSARKVVTAQYLSPDSCVLTTR